MLLNMSLLHCTGRIKCCWEHQTQTCMCSVMNVCCCVVMTNLFNIVCVQAVLSDEMQLSVCSFIQDNRDRVPDFTRGYMVRQSQRAVVHAPVYQDNQTVETNRYQHCALACVVCMLVCVAVIVGDIRFAALVILLLFFSEVKLIKCKNILMFRT